MKRIHQLASSDEAGFTLVELLLAMTVFISVMIIATVGFIGINRTYTRGVIRKQLSEGVQRSTEDITRALRTSSRSAAIASCSESTPPECVPAAPGYSSITINNGHCYFWRTGGNVGGLYRQIGSCSDASLDEADTLLGDRYTVEILQVLPVNTDSLYRIQGVFRTKEAAAIDLQLGQPLPVRLANVRCRGTTESLLASSCAVERFSFIVNARGAD